MNKAVFLDKDGTLIVDVPYNVDPSVISLYPFATDGLRQLQDRGYKLIVISNQSGVARGYFKEDALIKVFEKIQSLLTDHGIRIDAFYFCPHDAADGCNCRKPLPGLLIKASLDYDISLSESWMIGDILNDVEAGNVAGCRTVLIDNGNETEWQLSAERIPFGMTDTINDASKLILYHG